MKGRRIPWFILNLSLLLSMALSGCHEEPPPYKVSFVKSGRVSMVEGLLPVVVAAGGPELMLDRPAPADIKVYLTTSGAATDGQDYTILNPATILKGQTRGSVGLQFIDDSLDEPDEEGDLTIARVEGVQAVIDTARGSFLILDDDAADITISAIWAINDNVHMGLYLWHETSPGSNAFELVRSFTYPTTNLTGFAAISLGGLEKDGLYGVSYVYIDGAANNFHFTSNFAAVGNAILEGGYPALQFTGNYTLINRNSGPVVLREQYFTKQGFQYNNISQIVTPASGS